MGGYENLNMLGDNTIQIYGQRKGVAMNGVAQRHKDCGQIFWQLNITLIKHPIKSVINTQGRTIHNIKDINSKIDTLVESMSIVCFKNKNREKENYEHKED